ncbi:MAG: 2,3-bisphosphoglycerate-independent phosphoglycerate mutase, partial [Candidatus Pacebacteria bacterium]|nr:2,3-bisphosphoglycerate-independent phosphoglycerate mutase [Candidatus Paceibacterota bacterium]
MKGPVVLIIRDGWGHRMGVKNNAIVQGNTLNTDRLMREYPQTLIGAAGFAVGLPAGYQGNSEVGHMTIGAGRIIKQSLVRINESIKKGDFEKNETFLEAIDNAKKHGTALHLVGLLQTEGVH